MPETLSCTSDASLDFLWVSSGVGLARAILFLSFTTQKFDRTSTVRKEGGRGERGKVKRRERRSRRGKGEREKRNRRGWEQGGAGRDKEKGEGREKGGRREEEGERREEERGRREKGERRWIRGGRKERGGRRMRSWPLTQPGAIPCLWLAPTALHCPRLCPCHAMSCPHHHYRCPAPPHWFPARCPVTHAPHRAPPPRGCGPSLWSLLLSLSSSLSLSLSLSSLLCGVWWWEQWGWWGMMVVVEQPV